MRGLRLKVLRCGHAGCGECTTPADQLGAHRPVTEFIGGPPSTVRAPRLALTS